MIILINQLILINYMSKLSLEPHRDSELILEVPSEPLEAPSDTEELSDASPSDMIEIGPVLRTRPFAAT